MSKFDKPVKSFPHNSVLVDKPDDGDIEWFFVVEIGSRFILNVEMT